MFDKTMLENYELEVKDGNIPSDLLDKLLNRWWEMRDILKEIDRIYKTVVEEGLDPEVADGKTELALEKAFKRGANVRSIDWQVTCLALQALWSFTAGLFCFTMKTPCLSCKLLAYLQKLLAYRLTRGCFNCFTKRVFVLKL